MVAGLPALVAPPLPPLPPLPLPLDVLDGCDIRRGIVCIYAINSTVDGKMRDMAYQTTWSDVSTLSEIVRRR